MSRTWGTWLIVALAVAPVVLVVAGVGAWPAGPAGWLDLAGRLSGVLGLACLLLAGAVSVRAPGFDRPFGGLTRLWRLHHRLGLASFLLILAHPLLMALARAPLSPAAMLGALLPTDGSLRGWALAAGWIGLLAMMAFLAPSFQLFGLPEYQRWKALHFVSGLAMVAALVHALPLTGSLAPAAAAVLWGSLGTLAVGVFLWRALAGRAVLRKPWRVVENRALADRVAQLFLEPENGGPPLVHEPGQFVYLTPHDPGLRAGRDEEHPYTISSAPGAPRLEITVKALGDSSSALLDVAEGSRASVEGPYGGFLPPRPGGRRQLWIGGGIGITPFVSAARSRAAASGSRGDTVLINCANDPTRAYFLEALQAAGAEDESLAVVPHYFAREGPLDRDFVLAHCADAASREWFVCGPPVLLDVARRVARGLGVPRSRIHEEGFRFL